MTGEFISADEAKALGLVNRVAAAEALDDEVEAIVASIVATCRRRRDGQVVVLPPDRGRYRRRIWTPARPWPAT
ncbi:MAG: hypothetical protein U0792_09895 [Gemmataceae bacterium]